MNGHLDRFPPRKEDTKELKNICNRLDLIDIWRHKHPDKQTYTWSNKDRSQCSRIDFWLISSDIENKVDSVEIIPNVFSDHNTVSIKIKMGNNVPKCNVDYWKFNNSLLNNEEFTDGVEKLIDRYWKQAFTLNKYANFWELMKFEIRSLAISLGKKIAKAKQKRESELIEKLMIINEKNYLSDLEQNSLFALQSELNKVYEEKARGAFVRSRRKWLEQGEKCTKYFFNLEKRNSEISCLRQIRIGDSISEDAKTISQYVAKFYKELYTKDYFREDDIDLFVNNIKDKIEKISETLGKTCDQKIKTEEVDHCIKSLKDNKSPGNDGLTSEFYKFFIDKLTPFLVNLFEEDLEIGILPPTLRQGLIKLIPKSQKDKLCIENWRPISLLNNDAKIFALIFAKRLKPGLNDIIDEEESGFMPGRNISNNIRLILDMIDYNEYIRDDSFILFVDFYKAFDTISHSFMIRVIKEFGFGERFLKAIEVLYNGCNSSIKLAHGTTPRFDINRGIRQGCPLSPFLFLLVAQVMALHIKKDQFRGITALGREFKLSQLADDTTIFLANKNEIPNAIKAIKDFSQVSGLKMNINKSVLFPLKDCDLSEINGISIKTSLTYLGIIIDKNETNRSDVNFKPITEQITKRYNTWLMRDLSLHGRILLSKAEGISRSVYLSLSLEMPKHISKLLDKTLFDFIWRKKCHYLRKNVLCNTKKNGGMDVLTFETLNNSFKIKWLINLLTGEDNMWNAFPNHIFNTLGGIKFLLKCDYKLEKLPTKLSNFYKQALLAWKLIYKHNFSPTSCFIWNNSNVQYKNKSIFFPRWYENDIVLIRQLFNSHGHLLTYEEFLFKFNIPVPPKEYAIVLDAIPTSLLQLFKGICNTNQLTTQTIFLADVDLCVNSVSNKQIRNLFHTTTLPAGRFFWDSKFVDINWSYVWTIGNKYCLNNKVKEVSYKILHCIYPVKKTLSRFAVDMDQTCSFCGTQEETIYHLFVDCRHTHVFWTEVGNHIGNITKETVTFLDKEIILGYLTNKVDKDFIFITQLFLLLAKFHIHKAKWSNSKPRFQHFLNEINQYSHNIKQIQNKKAIKTNLIFEKFNV
uniref:Reverse transcriptase domain-containing protein n=1 Tax=Oryzias melastigma TaxID=30732 RepID=A0A3B3CA37_ORYME